MFKKLILVTTFGLLTAFILINAMDNSDQSDQSQPTQEQTSYDQSATELPTTEPMTNEQSTEQQDQVGEQTGYAQPSGDQEPPMTMTTSNPEPSMQEQPSQDTQL